MNSKRDSKILFNLILGDINSNFDSFLPIYSTFQEYIQNICIYSKKTINNLNYFQSKVDGHICNNKKDVIEFIKSSHSENLKPFPIIKVKTFKDYRDHYQEIHSKISSFYNNLIPYLYKQNYIKIRALINEEDERDMENLLKSFEAFEIKNNIEIIDSLILKEYRKKYFFSFLNKNIKNQNLNEGIIYFTSRFMYTLNSYANRKQNYFHGDKIFIAKDLPFSSILKFEKEKGNIIFFPDFKIATETKFNAQRTAIRFMPKQNFINKGLFLFYSLLKIILKIKFQMV